MDMTGGMAVQTMTILLSYIFVTCQSQVISQNVRLKDGDASYQGRLEIKYNGEWGTVCNGSFDNLAAAVVCQEFGLEFQHFYIPKPGPSGGRIWLNNVKCNGNEQSIFNCTHNGWGNVTRCGRDNDIGISCTITQGAIMLSNSPSNELGVGNVQYYQDEFRTLLNFSGWDDNDALVVCRQLGYSTTNYSMCLNSTCGPINCPPGNFPARLWKNNRIDCTGQETSLMSCPSDTWITYSECNDTYNAASVKCAVPVQGGWTSWVNTAPCSSRCADGMQTRIRSCSRPTPAYGGEDCIGDSKDAVQCGSNSCVKPKVTDTSPEQAVISNNTTVFHCNATAKPVASIKWLRDGSILNRSQINITYSTDGKDCNDDNPNNLCTSYSVLQLFNTQSADSGQYLCNASNQYYSDSRSVNLIVQVAPNITVPPLTQAVNLSTNITFICVANAKPRATIQWAKSGNVLSNSTTIRISSMTMGNCTITDPPEQCVISSILKIFNTQLSDSGVYTCNATNEAGYLENSATLSVAVAPNITMPPLTQAVNLSTNVTFICVANAKPRATIQWAKSGNVLSNTTSIRISTMTMGNCTLTDPPEQCVISSKLEIINAQPPDDGIYTCNATNEAGYLEKNATLSVDGAPVVEISPQNQDIIRYNNVSFVCIAIGYPRPVIEWLKNDTVLRNISTKVSLTKLLIINYDLGDCLTTECGLNSTLWIFNATADDMGNYTCSGSNIAGTDRRTAQLVMAIEHNDNNAHRCKWKIVAGVGVGVGVIVIIVCVVYCRHRRKNKGNDDDNGELNNLNQEQDQLINNGRSNINNYNTVNQNKTDTDESNK